MLQPLSTLFKRLPTPSWDEQDVRLLVQEFLRQQLRTDALYCDHVNNGVGSIRVASPADHQAIQLRFSALKHHVKQRTGYELTRVKIRQA